MVWWTAFGLFKENEMNIRDKQYQETNRNIEQKNIKIVCMLPC